MARALEHEHSLAAIQARLGAAPRQSYLRDWVLGGIDGAVTTFAVVSGVVGAQLSPRVILILGVANLVADGFSMAASNYLATKAERENLARLEAVEHRHVQMVPEGEREEVRQIFEKKGLAGEELGRVVDHITADPARWVRTMLAEEYGLPPAVRSPWLAALSTFTAFAVCGLLPLVPFIVRMANALLVSAAFTGGAFFALGAASSAWSTRSWERSGLTTLAVGSVAAALAYGVGFLLKAMRAA